MYADEDVDHVIMYADEAVDHVIMYADEPVGDGITPVGHWCAQ
jgi:hypothetical protein